MHKCFFPLPKQKRNRNEMKMKTVSKAKAKGKGKYARVPGSACVIARQTNTAWLFESLLKSSGSFHSSLSPSPHSSLVRLIQIFDCFSLWRQLLFVSIRSYFICLLCEIISQKAKKPSLNSFDRVQSESEWIEWLIQTNFKRTFCHSRVIYLNILWVSS